MLDKSIDGALLALRKQIIRDDGKGLKHFEALLRTRGVAMPRVLPPKAPDIARRGQMRAMILDPLRGGPKGLQEVAAHVNRCRPDLPPDRAYHLASVAMNKMRKAGMVRQAGRMWGLK